MEYNTYYFLKGFDWTEEKEKINIVSSEETPEVCAKLMENVETGSERYFIKFYRGHMIDPFDIDTKRARRGTHKYMQVNQECFKYYLVFLKTGSGQYKKYAERDINP